MKNRLTTGLILLVVLSAAAVSSENCPKEAIPVEPVLHAVLMGAEKEMEKGRNQKALDLLGDYSRKTTAKPHPQLPFLKGLIQYRLKRFEASEILFKEAIELNPCFGEAWQNLAVVYYRQKKPARAAQAMENAFSLIRPENRDLQYQSALFWLMAKKPENALATLEQLTQKGNPATKWLISLAQTRKALGQTGKAAEAMEKAFEKSKDPDLLYEAALLRIGSKEPKKAIALLQKLVRQKHPKRSWFLLLADTLKKEKRTAEAAKALAQGMTGEEMSADRFRSALLYLKEGKPQKALPILRKLSETANPNPQWRIALASTLDRLDRPEEASAVMKKVDPNAPPLSPEMRLRMAVFWLKHDHPERAVKLLEKLAEDPHAARDCLMAQVEALVRTGKPKSAEIPLKKLLNRYPQDEKIWRLAAWTAIEQTAYGKAAAALEVAFRLAPPKSGDWKRLGNLYRLAGIPRKAAEAYVKEFGERPTADNLDLLAYTYQEAHQMDKALEAAALAAKLNPSAKRFSRLGQLHMARQDCAKGMAAFLKAAQLDDSGGVNSLSVGYAAWKLDRLVCAKTAFQSALQKADSASEAASRAKRALKTIEQIMKKKSSNGLH